MSDSTNPNATEQGVTRRWFLGAAGSVAALASAPKLGSTAPARKSANDKLNLAGIGFGGMGASNLRNLESENIVALCDVDHDYAANTFKRYPDAKVYTDYRELLDKQKDLDAVVIATPDHTHAVISMAAMKAGKHVYCQKPLTHDVYEARSLAQAAKETGVATQMGIQGHSMEGLRLVCEWIWDGAIGNVYEVDAWCDLSYYPWGHAGWSSKWGTRPTDTPAVPASLNWDLWLGPAPERPYHPAYHPAVWRCWWEFGCGMMGDRGAHTLDPVCSALKLTQPTSIEATSCGLNPDTHPLTAIVTYRFPKREGFPPLKLTWYEGLRAPRPEELDADIDMPGEAAQSSEEPKAPSCAASTAAARGCCPSRSGKHTSNPRRRCPESPARTSWTGSAPARPVTPPAPTSATPGRSPRCACWATSPSAWTPASSGTPPT